LEIKWDAVKIEYKWIQNIGLQYKTTVFTWHACGYDNYGYKCQGQSIDYISEILFLIYGTQNRYFTFFNFLHKIFLGIWL